MQKSNREEIRLIFTMRAQPKAAYLPCSSDLRGRVGGVWDSGEKRQEIITASEALGIFSRAPYRHTKLNVCQL